MSEKKRIVIALAGNPNAGKTALFNAITGAKQKTGNYPGVTVEKKVGTCIYKGYECSVIDLPGTYSLTAYSLDEIVARDFLIKEKPDVIVDVLDSTNLERNLFLCLQFQELGIPVVGALNMNDQAKANGIFIDEKHLSTVLRIPFVKTVATTGKGIDTLLENVIETKEAIVPQESFVSYGEEVEKEIAKLLPIIQKDKTFCETYPVHWLLVKLIEKDAEAKKLLSQSTVERELTKQLEKSIAWLEEHFGMDTEIAVSEERYGYIHGAIKEVVRKETLSRVDVTETIDKVLINRFLGPVIFVGIIWGIFQLTFTLGEHPMGWLETFFGGLSELAMRTLPEGVIRSLVVDGIIAGVGGVFSFVPLIILLFLFISFLEDTGYMSRAAFVMDKFLHIFGLHGQSFMPMMLGFGCSVPAIMAARTLKSPKDRIITILVTPFMSCGAKLPVYILLAGAFFPKNAGNVILSIYIIGVLLALLAAVILRKTVLPGKATPFVMELPPYRLPTVRSVLWHVWGKTWAYIRKAGTIILLASVIIWAITSFPTYTPSAAHVQSLTEKALSERVDTDAIRNDVRALLAEPIDLSELENEEEHVALTAVRQGLLDGEKTVEDVVATRAKNEADAHVETMLAEEALEKSIAGRIGKTFEPLVAPLGFDWRIAISAITGFAAKEVVVSTLGVLYSVGLEEGEESESLRETLKNDPNFSPLVAYVLMLFTLILAPCFAALAVIRSELGWKWLGFAVAYTTVVAWFLSFAVFQIGTLAGLGV